MTQYFEKDSRVLLAIHFLSLVESMASADTEGLVNMEELLAVEEEDDLARSYARLDITECTVQWVKKEPAPQATKQLSAG